MEFSRNLNRGHMKKSRFTDSQIIAILKQAEADLSRDTDNAHSALNQILDKEKEQSWVKEQQFDPAHQR